MSGKRVAVLHYTAGTAGGVEEVIVNHLLTLKARGYDLRLIVGRQPVQPLRCADVPIHIIPLLDPYQPEASMVQEKLAEINHNISRDEILVFAALIEKLKTEFHQALDGVDVLIIHNILTHEFHIALVVALWELMDENLGVKVVAWTHDLAYLYDSRTRWWPWSLLRTPRGDVTYVTVSQDRARGLADRMAIREREIIVVPNGVSPEYLFQLAPEITDLAQRLSLLDPASVLILVPARLNQRKNLKYVLRVAAALKAFGVQAYWLVSGPPNIIDSDQYDPVGLAYLEELKELRGQLGLTRREFIFLFEEGYVLPDRLFFQLFWLADTIAFFSIEEGFGLPLLESAMFGRPIFVTELSVFREVGSEFCHFVPFANSLTAASIMEREIQKSSVIAGRLHAKANTWNSILSKELLSRLFGG